MTNLIIFILTKSIFNNLSDIFKANRLVENFSQILYNIFMPLFEVTDDPSSHPYLHKFLCHVSLFLFIEEIQKKYLLGVRF